MLSVVRSRSRVRKPLLIWTLLAPSTYLYVLPPDFSRRQNPSLILPAATGHVRVAPDMSASPRRPPPSARVRRRPPVPAAGLRLRRCARPPPPPAGRRPRGPRAPAPRRRLQLRPAPAPTVRPPERATSPARASSSTSGQIRLRDGRISPHQPAGASLRPSPPSPDLPGDFPVCSGDLPGDPRKPCRPEVDFSPFPDSAKSLDSSIIMPCLTYCISASVAPFRAV